MGTGRHSGQDSWGMRSGSSRPSGMGTGMGTGRVRDKGE
eukprot:CAMPEP_0174313590 /NCGR_PEP_ID=MMETSP0810-20121108/5081_1 /TAXON_ID=73025 ORGANISM="Eutreptiella gymnastica-like, Strain CCMP1594" /NCGR_SAMPLE_ID=MMETSP0810 /ASSEMBLY_ACC=CAM_ASM_000659 /LENGTH=38 /DNA_ID= /DNA_START= /DNA_END= /DNA_ORIENTATION=